MDAQKVLIPRDLLPADGRFGCGPSAVPEAHLSALAATGRSLMGTSHRRGAGRALLGRVREQLAELFTLPDGYEVAVGLGGATSFWDVACFSLIERQAQSAVLGAFSGKFADAIDAAPFLNAADRRTAPAGARPILQPADAIDTYCLPHIETSTGVTMTACRPVGSGSGSLTLVDATSAAGALPVDIGDVDVYYFSPQKAFAADGGLWVALLSPAAIERAERLAAIRWAPPTLSLASALAASRTDQTLNTPALATLFLLEQSVSDMLAAGGLPAACARTTENHRRFAQFVDRRPDVSWFVADPAARSAAVATIELAGASVADVTGVLSRHGIVDVDAYRGVGVNQLRVGLFPQIDPDDVTALAACLGYVLDALAA